MKQFNSLIIVADSCRYDTFIAAKALNIRKHFEVVSAGAMGTFTYPAHMSMFQGFFPSAKDGGLIYDRFTMSIYRWFYRSKRSSIAEVSGNGSIPLVLRQQGHRTVAVGGVGWFNKRTPMSLGFDHFIYKPDAVMATSSFLNHIDKEPFYGLLNYSTTHRPYKVPDSDGFLLSPKSGTSHKPGFNKLLWEKQVACLDYIDNCLSRVFDWLKTLKLPTIVCFCADHGDCFGEDGCYGHGFYHPFVMEVPLGWSIFNNGECRKISKSSLEWCKLL